MRSPESYLEDLVRGLRVESVLDVGTGHSGVFDYWFWESKPLRRKACLDIALIREDIDPSWERHYADARSLPFPDDSFDVVQCTEMIEHVPPEDHRRVLRELKRVARKLVFLTSSGLSQHRPSPEEDALEKINPFAKYQGIVSRDLLEEEGFEILFYYKKGYGENVRAFYRKKGG